MNKSRHYVKVGEKFGKLTVISFAGHNRRKKTWSVMCDCGTTKILPSDYLTSGDSKSCGCLIREKANELFIGKTFGNVTIVEYTRTYKENAFYLAKCNCGYEFEIASYAIRRTQQCKKCSDNKLYQGIEQLSGQYFGTILKGAEKRNIPFNITKEYIWSIFEKQNFKCALSGESIYFSRNKRPLLQTASVDRIDSSQGYIEGNIQIVHKKVNKMKMDISQKDFIDTCIKIANKFNNGKINE